jgi:hypothetical protein
MTRTRGDEEETRFTEWWWWWWTYWTAGRDYLTRKQTERVQQERNKS